jgi:murein L,D-transpeptidase YafK
VKRESCVIALAGLLQLFIGCCYAAPAQYPAGQISVDRIVVEKAKRQLHLLAAGKVLRTYRIALGSNPVGPKTQEGDGKTPEGVYVIDGRYEQSGFHKALHISYPSMADEDRARQAGVDPGGDIMIHGIRNGLGWIGPAPGTDWTQDVLL